MIALSTSGLSLFLFCFFGKMATESYENMSNALFESDWQKLSIDMRKYLLLMIKNAQRPLYFHGFRVIALNLETFSKVSGKKMNIFMKRFAQTFSFQLLKTVFSYYMLFKTITSK